MFRTNPGISKVFRVKEFGQDRENRGSLARKVCIFI